MSWNRGTGARNRKGGGAEDSKTGARGTGEALLCSQKPVPEGPEQWPQARCLHTGLWILSGPGGALMRPGGEATPFFITDTPTGSPQPRTLAS